MMMSPRNYSRMIRSTIHNNNNNSNTTTTFTKTPTTSTMAVAVAAAVAAAMTTVTLFQQQSSEQQQHSGSSSIPSHPWYNQHNYYDVKYKHLTGSRSRMMTYCAALPQQQHHRMIPFSPPPPPDDNNNNNKPSSSSSTTKTIRPGGQMIENNKEESNHDDTDTDDSSNWYYGLFPLRQLFIPAVEYPLWDENWDERHYLNQRRPSHRVEGVDGHNKENVDAVTEKEKDRIYHRTLRKNGITRHIILVRHGQYDETHKDDTTRILTPLGRDQAHLTGKRIAEMIHGAAETFGSPCRVKALRVSDLTRAKETATIIASYLPSTVTIVEPDPMLNEGRPCHTIPGGRISTRDIETTDRQHARIEGAFRKYFYRAAPPPELGIASEQETTTTTPVDVVESKHEFEIIVCHANVIRYIMCRALQLPPEAWLRFCPFNCSLTYLTIRPTGTVSCRMIGDIGHLPYSASTFSGHLGYNW